MYRLLLIVAAAAVFALPGVYAVSSSAAAAPAAPDPSPSASVSPSPSPGDADAPVTIATGADERWHRGDVVVHLSATDPVSGIAYTLFKVDDGAWTKGTRIEVPAPRNHANDGAHSIRFYSVDNAQNAEQEKSVTVKIDTTPPDFEWRDVSPGVIDRVQAVRFRFIVRDDRRADSPLLACHGPVRELRGDARAGSSASPARARSRSRRATRTIRRSCRVSTEWGSRSPTRPAT